MLQENCNCAKTVLHVNSNQNAVFMSGCTRKELMLDFIWNSGRKTINEWSASYEPHGLSAMLP